MVRVEIVYSPDNNSAGQITRNKNEVVDPRSGRVISINRSTPDDYLSILQPKKGPGRMEFNPYIPKTLTPRGYTKLKLMLSVANKQYETLVRRLLKEGSLWEDPDFPASDSSIGNMPDVLGRIEWKRPSQLVRDPKFFVGGASRFDVQQGALGDCWVLAVVASIASYPQLFDQVVPKDQTLFGQHYCGVFRVRFWNFGQWVEVLVDDRLPVYRGRNQLVFMHSTDADEFWPAIVEKAYAKLNGCYAHLSGGAQSEAMEDLTGGICETIDLQPNKRPKDLLEQMKVYCKRCCLMGCSLDSDVIEQRMNNGLIGGHAYSVTGIHPVTYRGSTVWLVRCRNPWGGSHEWKGAWADNAPQWRDVSTREREALNLKFSADGEFWMSYDDFVNNFTRLEVCHLGLESLEHNQDFHGKRRLDEAIFAGQWQKGVSAGGCINNRSTYHTNPQFCITVEDPDPDDNDRLATIIIGLMQKDVRKKYGAQFQAIGFMVYEAPSDQNTLLTRAQFLTRSPVAKSQFINTREVTGEFRLKPGTYIIVPSTFDPNIELNFILRVFSQVAIKQNELDDDNIDQGLPEDVIEAIKLEDMALNENEEIARKFTQVMDPTLKAITAIQLRSLLNESTLQDIPKFQGFNLEMCRSMVAAVDMNLTGYVELSEFMGLWTKANGWKHIFLKHDVDRSGYFNAYEFREALNDAGYRVSNRLFNALVHRYGNPETEKICFEDFLLCVVRLKCAFDTNTAQPKNLMGTSLYNSEDYLRFAAYI